MPEPPAAPGPYILEVPSGARAIQGLRTDDTAFVGAMDGLAPGECLRLQSHAHFERVATSADRDTPLGLAIRQFYSNGGGAACIVGRAPGPPDATRLRDALASLASSEADVPDFNLLCVPEAFDLPEADAIAVLDDAARLCEARRAFFIADVPRTVPAARAAAWAAQLAPSANAALYLPALRIGRAAGAGTIDVAPSGTLAGLYARTDAQRGVHAAPAGTDAGLRRVFALAEVINDATAGQLNRAAVNTLRQLGFGPVAWGARTLAGAEGRSSDWRYVPVRRLALHIERSVLAGLQWAVFEPNDEPLWAQVRLAVGSFLHGLFRAGAFQGSARHDAYFVRCDATRTTAADVANGVFHVEIGFAPLRPAEFVVLRITQAAGPAG